MRWIRLTDDLPVVGGVHQHVEGQPALGQGAGLQAVLQQVGALQVRGRADAAVGLQVLQQADVLEEGVENTGYEGEALGEGEERRRGGLRDAEDVNWCPG